MNTSIRLLAGFMTAICFCGCATTKTNTETVVTDRTVTSDKAVIYISPDGKITLNDKPVSLGELPDQLVNSRVLLKIHPRTSFDRVTPVKNVLEAAGIKDVEYATEPGTNSAGPAHGTEADQRILMLKGLYPEPDQR